MKTAVWGKSQVRLAEIMLGGGLILVAIGAGAFGPVAPLLLPFYLGIGLAGTVAGVFILRFFRDPERRPPEGGHRWVSPADGRVTHVEEVQDCEFVGEPCLMVGIFLSVFDVHVNRAPCDAEVAYVQHRPGAFLDARDPESGRRNESNAVGLLAARPGGDPVRVLVRQVAGKVARRIVCAVAPGQKLVRGQRIGMIKFGSRTELYVPLTAGPRPAVQVGDRAQGGRTVLFELGERVAGAGQEAK